MIHARALAAMAALLAATAVHGQEPVVMTREACERSAGLPTDTSSAAIPHYCFGTFASEVEVLRACTRHKIDFNKVCFNHGTPMDFASGRASEPMMRLLMAAGADPHGLNLVGWTHIYSVVNACGVYKVPREDCLAAIKLLKDAGVDINKPDPGGRSPLWWSLSLGDPQLTEDLILLGGDVNRTNHWMTPLDYAVEMKMTRMIPVLERHGAKRAGGFNYAMQQVNRALGGLVVALFFR